MFYLSDIAGYESCHGNSRSKNITKVFCKFRKDENGSLIIFSLFLLIMMLMVAGMAVDLMISEAHRTRLQSTLDRAVLAGASLEQTLNSEAVVLDYFQKAGLGAYIDAADISVVKTATSKTVSATASMNVDTYFMNLLGINSLSAHSSGQAEESLSDIEISLVLDVSGSMSGSSASGNSKISELISAATEFVYLMQCDPDAEQPFDDVCVVEQDTVSISLIPYAEQVLIGEDLLQQFNITNEHTDSSCVDFTAADFLTTSTSLTVTLQRAGTLDRRTNHSNGHGSNSRFARDLNTNSSNARTCRTNLYRTIVPYSNSYTDLQARIGTLEARGYTSIQLGMKWATTLLDPEFRPALTNLTLGATPMIDPEFVGRPFDYTRPRTQKVVVLMTDGKNTSLYSLKPDFRSGPSPFWLNKAAGIPEDDELSVYRESTGMFYRVKKAYDASGNYTHWHPTPYGGSDAVQMTFPELWNRYNVDYWDDEFRWLPDSWNYVGNTTMNSYLYDICDVAKAKGIEVFTLGFETSSSSSAVMARCASSASHHFDVDGTDISEAFNSIAREIHQLRLIN